MGGVLGFGTMEGHRGRGESDDSPEDALTDAFLKLGKIANRACAEEPEMRAQPIGRPMSARVTADTLSRWRKVFDYILNEPTSDGVRDETKVVEMKREVRGSGIWLCWRKRFRSG